MSSLEAAPQGRISRSRLALFETLGGLVCSKCGFDDWRALQIDHIFANGKEMRLTKPGILNYYLDNPDMACEELQVLCANCNWVKRWENDELRR